MIKCMSCVLKTGTNIIPKDKINIEAYFNVGKDIVRLISRSGLDTGLIADLCSGSIVKVHLIGNEVVYHRNSNDIKVCFDERLRRTLMSEDIKLKIGKVMLSKNYLFDYLSFKELCEFLVLDWDPDFGDITLYSIITKGFFPEDLLPYSYDYKEYTKWVRLNSFRVVERIPVGTRVGSFCRLSDENGCTKVRIDDVECKLSEEERGKLESIMSGYIPESLNLHSITWSMSGFNTMFLRDSSVVGESDLLLIRTYKQ